MNLKVRYALEQQKLEPQYWVIDADTDEVLTDPMPYDEAWHAMQVVVRQAQNPPVQH